MPQTQIIGVQMYFNEDQIGTTKPSTWTNLGVVDSLTIEAKQELKELIGPAPGRRDRLDVLLGQRVLDFKAMLKQVNPVAWQLAFGCLTLTAGSSVQFNPGAGSIVKGWAKFQGYDTNNSIAANWEVYCALHLENGLELSAELISPPISGMVIRNSLNTGAFTNLL